MERFLEANRVVESSLTKLRRPAARAMCLRDALLVSSTMNRAQEVASNVCSLSPSSSFSSPSTVKASRLLASMRAPEEDSAVSLLMDTMPSTCSGTSSNRSSVASPLSLSSAAKEQVSQEDEVMEFISSNSVLSDILKEEEEPEMDISQSSWPSTPLSDVSNTCTWSPWTKRKSNTELVPSLQLQTENDMTWPEERGLLSPPSPGKRHHAIAFPSDHSTHTPSPLTEDGDDYVKRFKSSEPSFSLGFSDSLLTPRTFSSTPLITFMCGTEFTRSGPSGWPVSFSGLTQDKTDNSTRHQSSLSPSKLYSVLAY
uniref:SERTA domain-containing protein n=1 Tax=Amphimedon queenslandica TaxID=400682 RepID=A0A1X7VBA3_AMPQE